MNNEKQEEKQKLVEAIIEELKRDITNNTLWGNDLLAKKFVALAKAAIEKYRKTQKAKQAQNFFAKRSRQVN